MKIDESSINHNALRMIKEVVGIPWEYCDTTDHDADGCRIVTLGAVYGVILLADELKQLLKQ